MGASRPFDPLTRRFVAQFAKPAELEPVNLRALTPFQRALLVIDGTVTRFIETYTLEPTQTIRIDQVRFNSAEDHQWLDIKEGAEVGLRRVYIQGQHSETLYVYAIASVALERIPAAVLGRLEVQGESLGKVLNRNRLETRREILWYGKEHVADLPEAVAALCDGTFYSRTYRIIHDGAPIALINEKFPVETADQPSQY